MATLNREFIAYHSLVQYNKEDLIKVLNDIPDNYTDVILTGTLVLEHNVEKYKVNIVTNPHYQHEDGRTKSINARWELALKVKCPACKQDIGLYCLNMNNFKNTGEIRGINYPHEDRTREALRQQHEAELEFP